jgi:hypothetical protein
VEQTVASPISDSGTYQCHVGDDRLLEHHRLAVEGPHLLRRRDGRHGAVRVIAPGKATLRDQGTDACRRVERSDSSATAAQALREGTLRSELDDELTGKVLARELLIFSYVRRDHPADPLALQ